MGKTGAMLFQKASALLDENWAVAAILLLVLAQFFLFTSIFPLVGGIDEVSETLDGIAIQSYINDIFTSGRLSNPISYFQGFQDHTFGLSLKSRPPYFRSVEAGIFLFTSPSIENARLAALLHALAFFAAWCLVISRYYGKTAAFASSLLLLSSFSFMEYSWRVYTEFSYIFFALLAVYSFHLYLDERSNRNLVFLFCSLFLGLMAKEIFIAIFPAFAFMFIARLDFSHGLAGARKAVLQLLENKWFIPAAVATAALSLPWYLLKASTPLFTHLAVSRPIDIQSLLYYPSLLLASEPVLTLSFIAFLAILLFSKKQAQPNGFDYALISLFAGFFIVVTFASSKELRYLFFIYPLFALFAARLAFETKPIARFGAAAFAVLLAAQLLLSYNAAIQLPQIASPDWEHAAKFAESKGGVRMLYAGGPSNYWLSYYLARDNAWKQNFLARLYPTVLNPVSSEKGVAQDSPDFIFAMMDYYSLDRVLIDNESNEGQTQRQIVAQAVGTGNFSKEWESGNVKIYRKK